VASSQNLQNMTNSFVRFLPRDIIRHVVFEIIDRSQEHSRQGR
jgi:hypothetical protein